MDGCQAAGGRQMWKELGLPWTGLAMDGLDLRWVLLWAHLAMGTNNQGQGRPLMGAVVWRSWAGLAAGKLVPVKEQL